MTISLYRSNGTGYFNLELDLDEDKGKTLRVSSNPPAFSAEFILAPQISVSEYLLSKDQDGTRLKTLHEIREEATESAKQLESEWHALINKLSTAQFKLVEEAKFLGALVFPTGYANISGKASLNLGACLLDNTVSLSASFEISADCNVNVNTFQINTCLAWQLQIDATVSSPYMSVQLPSLGLHFPEFSMPNFSWQGCKFLNRASFDFRFPTLPGIPLKLTYDDPPELTINYYQATGNLNLRASINNAQLSVFTSTVPFGNPVLDYQGGALAISGLSDLPIQVNWAAQSSFPLPPPLAALSIELGAGSLQLALDLNTGGATFKGLFIQQITVFPTAQPSKKLTLNFTLPFEGDQFTNTVIINGTETIRSVKLLAPSSITLDTLFKYLPETGSVCLNLKLPTAGWDGTEHLIEVLSAILASVTEGLAGLARIVEAGLRALFSLLRLAANTLSKLEITIILDARSGNLQQILLSLHRANNNSNEIFNVAGLELEVPVDADLALMIDLRNGEGDAYLVATTETQNLALLKLSTDLWFSSETMERPAGERDSTTPPSDAQRSPKLISVSVNTQPNVTRCSVIPFGIRHGEAVFLHALTPAIPNLNQNVQFDGYQLTELDPLIFDTKMTFQIEEGKNRILPFLAAPNDTPNGDPPSGEGLVKMLKQYIEITATNPLIANLDGGKFKTTASVGIIAMGSEIKSELELIFDAHRMTANVSGGEIKISVKKGLEILGMQVSFLNRVDKTIAKSNQMVLDMRSADPRMYINDELIMVLNFDRISTGANGKPLSFEVESFVVHGGGLDLDAKLDGNCTIPLNGLGTYFTFDSAKVRVRSGRAESFSLGAWGKLPPELLGDVDVRLQLDFGMRTDGGFGMLQGDIQLKNNGKPVRCEMTHFVLTLDGLSVRIFEDHGKLHFCAFVSGSAVFRPEAPTLSEGMLKKLAGVELKFTDCPVCGDSDVIRRELEKLNLSFLVALDKPAKATLFDLFKFEVRSIGFEPSSAMFDDKPFALVIGGQISFAASGDVVRAECDFHKLYLAPPAGKDKDGKTSDIFLPRIRCEGLGLALRIGGSFEVEGKVVAVDERMPPNVLESKPTSENLIKANGFIGQGRVAIQGLPPFAASFGFVEVKLPKWARPKLAWFVYLEAQRLSYYFQLGPVPLYLREVGLGLGFCYTYVGIKAIDEAKSLPEMIRAVDAIAETAVEPSKLESWVVAPEDPDLTLLGRIMISTSSASAPNETLVWKEDAEKELPNLLLLNAVAAMRRDTFLMTANVWLGYNYYDWDQARHIRKNELIGKQTMTGYVILSGARSEFLARLKSNPGAEIGPRLPLPKQFLEALKEIEYDATLYIRPGLLHFELGWPDRIRWSSNIAGINLNVTGGAIFRVHEGAMLVGLNLEGDLSFELSGRLDAGVVGVAVTASVYAALTSRIIGYLDSQQVSRSLYYSLFNLHLNVNFAISAWLEIDAWLCKITIRISFAISLQIDVMIEMALGYDQLGARARATIGISIFGRSLGVSVGIGFNPGLVDNAASRVGRFMNMGLLQEVPSVTPDIGNQDQANQKSTDLGKERREARVVAGKANNSSLAKVPHEDPLPKELLKNIAAYNIGPTDFQIVLTHLKARPHELDENTNLDEDEWVYMTFLPLDAAPTHQKSGCKSSFYAAPKYPYDPNQDTHPDVDHKIIFPTELKGIYLFKDQKWVEPPNAGELLDTSINWKVMQKYTQSTEKNKDKENPEPTETSDKTANMTQLFFAAFRTTAKKPEEVNDDNPYQEPNARLKIVNQPIQRIPYNPQNQYHHQELAYSKNIQQDPADRRCHEARDFLLQKFISDLFQLAADGKVPSDSVHVVHLGLTFLVRKEFAEAVTNNEKTIVQKRVQHPILSFVNSSPCKVFNPLNLTFENNPPRFDKTRPYFDDNKAKLDWDLTWDYQNNEPEHFVQHYEVTRWIEIDGAPISEARKLTFKRADMVSFSDDGQNRVVKRSPWQYTDEFEDMSASAKAQLYDPTSNLLLRYTVVPVCVSGTRGIPCSDFILQRTGLPQLAPLKHASAVLKVKPIADKTNPNQVTSVDLLLRLEAGADAINKSDKDDNHYWRLVLRSEPILPAGQYGTDAETQRPLRSILGDGRTLRKGDELFIFSAQNELQFPFKDDPKIKAETHASVTHFKETDEANNLLSKLKDIDNPRAHLLFAQSVVKRKIFDKNTEKDKEVEVACSTLIPMELSIELICANSNINPLVARVDMLELVRLPLVKENCLLDPVARVDVAALSGRAVLREPNLENNSDESNIYASRYIPHPEYGGLTQLSWNLRPSNTNGTPLDKYRLLSGFDVYSLDLDSQKASSNEAWQSKAKRVTSARLLSADSARLTPGEVGEPSNWKVRYPSQVARRLAGGAWYSDAESIIEWPRPDVRRELLPEPPSELIKALLREGVPEYIELKLSRVSNSKPEYLNWKFHLPLPDADADAGYWTLNTEESESKVYLQYIKNANPQPSPAATLRKALRKLYANPILDGHELEDADNYAYTIDDKLGWTLSMTPFWGKPEDALNHHLPPEEIPMLFDRDLHPLLEAILTRMRRYSGQEGTNERLLDLDRRPPPVADAKTVSAFIDATSETADPYGWAILDRLGLGVTIRLFDPVNDVFLSPDELHAQLILAIKNVNDSGLYKSAQKHLFVEVLLQPGGMTRRSDFSSLPDSFGVLENVDVEMLMQDHALAMVRLSIRPVINKVVQYKVLRCNAENAEDKKHPGVEAILLESGEHFDLGSITLSGVLRAANKHLPDYGRTSAVILRGMNINIDGAVKDDVPSSTQDEDDLPDPFGRFSTWKGWEDDAKQSINYFHTSLRNALGLLMKGITPDEQKQIEDELAQIKCSWLIWNARFFEYAADPSAADVDATQYAFAAMEATEPLMIASNSAGQLTVMVPEADGYAHQRAFTVLPQWRYAKLLKAAGYALDSMTKPNSENIASGCNYVISTVMRTAPIQPPAVLSVGRLGDKVWWRDSNKQLLPQEDLDPIKNYTRLGVDPGNELPVIVSHHTELCLSKTNVVIASSLSLSGMLTSFVLTLVDNDWCRRNNLEAEKLEGEHRVVIDTLLTENSTNEHLLQDVAAQLNFLPTEAKVRVMRNLPHWYRHTVVVSVAAGTALAETVSTYLAEAPARLVEIDTNNALTLKDEHPWTDIFNSTSPPIKRPVESMGTPPYAFFDITLPALRYRDTTDNTTAALWSGIVANFADPGVVYELELESMPSKLRTRTAVTPLARIARSPKHDEFFTVFPLSKEWKVSCTFEPGTDAVDPKHELRLSVTPMSKPVLLDSNLKDLLATDYLTGQVLRVPGGWNAEWMNYFVSKLVESDLAQRLTQVVDLWQFFSTSEIGVPATDFSSLFPIYALAELTLKRPEDSDSVGWVSLETALSTWVNSLKNANTPLALLLNEVLNPQLGKIKDRSFQDLELLLPWLSGISEMIEPSAPCILWVLKETPQPRMLLPELMTDEEYDIAYKASNKDEKPRLEAIRAAQRKRVLAGGALRIRATRGDAIPLELPLITLT